ncbi:MAG: hypothetical protein FRX48_07633 [Lasallia pustulata]|uniref:Uncharacterized protein n=1 Tax=Lasallia pustulata TaxID=136370 RepID=A0A5M8PGP8_9LECA|nr:MAG: hypothetical protein FRX48_07633 [Lasallia pustulata]
MRSIRFELAPKATKNGAVFTYHRIYKLPSIFPAYLMLSITFLHICSIADGFCLTPVFYHLLNKILSKHYHNFNNLTAFPPSTIFAASSSSPNAPLTASTFILTLGHTPSPSSSSNGGKNGRSVPNSTLSFPTASTAAFNPTSE